MPSGRWPGPWACRGSANPKRLQGWSPFWRHRKPRSVRARSSTPTAVRRGLSDTLAPDSRTSAPSHRTDLRSRLPFGALVAAKDSRPLGEFGKVSQRPRTAEVVTPCVHFDVEEI